VDGALDLIKGGGGALLREKIVAAASDRLVVIADAGKRVESLGAFPLPVEVVPFGWRTTQGLVEEALEAEDVLGREAVLRMDGSAPFVTDGGHHILDLRLRRIGDARRLALALLQVPGVVETGLFVGMCDTLILGGADGRVELRDASGPVEVARAAPEGPGNIFTEVAP
jgi:ribose 5-phosphate isomerase A